MPSRAEIAPFEAHAALREAVDVRRFDPVRAGAVAAEGFVRLVVGVDEENVGPLGGRRVGGNGAYREGDQGDGDDDGSVKECWHNSGGWAGRG